MLEMEPDPKYSGQKKVFCVMKILYPYHQLVEKDPPLVNQKIKGIIIRLKILSVILEPQLWNIKLSASYIIVTALRSLILDEVLIM